MRGPRGLVLRSLKGGQSPLWSQGPGNETWRTQHLRWTLRCGEDPDRWKCFERVVQGEGPAGAKAQQLENTRCFNLPAKERVCRAAEEGRCGKEKGLRISCRPGVDRVCLRSSPESDSIRCVLPCPGGGSGYKQWGRRGLLWRPLPTILSTTIPARSCPQGPQLWKMLGEH